MKIKYGHPLLKFLFTLLVGLTIDSVNGINVNASNANPIYRNVNPNQEQTVTIGLKNHNNQQLDRFIYQTVDPKSKNYRKYLTPQQFGLKYGLSDRNVAVVEKFMAKNHLKADTYPGHLLMTVTGKTKDLERTFHFKLRQTTNQKHNYQIDSGTARVKQSISKYVTFIDQLGLRIPITDNKTDPSKQTLSTLDKIKDSNISDRSYRKFGRAYDTGSLYAKGSYGQKQTIGIISDSNFKMSDVSAYLKKQRVDSDNERIKRVYVNKQLAKDKGDRMEVTMDVEQASAIAPKANINVYLGNDNYSGYFLTSYATAIAKDNVDVISSSFGLLENQLANSSRKIKGETDLLEMLLKQAAAQGITVFNAAGDNGAYGFAMGSKERGVFLPASSPYVTAVGGTTLPFKNVSFSDAFGFTPTTGNRSVSLAHESTWSNTTSLSYLFGGKFVAEQLLQHLLSAAKTDKERQAIEKVLDDASDSKIDSTYLANVFLGGGGGFSAYFKRPDYQVGISGVGTYNARQYIDITKGVLNANSQLITGHASGRNVPDISGNADVLTGYNIYIDGKYDPSGDGTSVVTPQMAAMAAVINSAQNKRMGFWNPQIYRFAKTATSPFTPLNSTDDNNLYYTGQPGKIYNQASGLGTVNFTKLNATFSKAK